MKKILVLQGGYNEEHKVSINTAKEVTKALKNLKINFKVVTVNPLTFDKDILSYSKNYICFNALHGVFGEDGKIQKILKKNKFRLTHSNESSSSNCFNKIISKKIINKYKIFTPLHSVVKCKNLNKNYLDTIKKKLKRFVIKPVCSGSSYGLKIIKTKKDLNNLYINLGAYKNQFKESESFLIEEYISGKELTVSVLGNDVDLKPLEVTEIISLNKLYDYQAKYTKGFSKHYIPARISKKNYNKCLNLALRIHKIFKCTTLSRVDFIFDRNKNKIYFLEINSQPGLTKLSLLPEQAKYQGVKFENIILQLINNAK